MPDWQALPCELKLQIYRDLIDAILRVGSHWLFADEPSFTIIHGIHDILLVAPELRQHTLELVEKVLVVATSDFGLGKEYKLRPIQMLGPKWGWRSSKGEVEQLKKDILKEVKQEMKRQATCARRMEKRTALRIAAIEAEDSKDL